MSATEDKLTKLNRVVRSVTHAASATGTAPPAALGSDASRDKRYRLAALALAALQERSRLKPHTILTVPVTLTVPGIYRKLLRARARYGNTEPGPAPRLDMRRHDFARDSP